MHRPGWPTVVLVALGSAGITWLIALAVLGGSDTTTVRVVTVGGATAPAANPAAPGDAQAARVAELEREVAALRASRSPRPRAAAPAQGPQPDPPTPAPPAVIPHARTIPIIQGVMFGNAKQAQISADDARHAAERFAAAVRAGNDGSVWLPLAVSGPPDRPESWAPLNAVVRDSAVPAATRAAVLDALADAGRDVSPVAEDVLANSADPDLRAAALRAILASVRSGGAIPQIVRTILGDSAAPASERDMALAIVAARDPVAALPILEALTTSGDAAERQRGLGVLDTLRDKAYLPLMTRLIHADLGDATAGLADAIALTKDRKWSALQMTGEPDTPASGDYGTAWAAKAEQMSLVTLELTFPHAVVPESVRIRETLCPGAIASIAAEIGGAWETLWEGQADSAPPPRWFEPGLRTASATTRRIRIVVDTNRCAGWEEIDAVELVGGGTRQWADGATATSSYSD